MRGVQTSPETQERVRQAAEELGYTGNAVARALARGRTGLVGVLSGSLQDLSEQRFVESLGRQLGRHDLHMVVVDARGEPERERMLARQLADQLVDGLVISPLDPSDDVVGRDRRGAPGRHGRRRARRADGGGGAVRQPRRRRAGARAPARARPPPHRRAHAEPPVDAGPAGRARRRRGVRRARARGDGRQLAPLDRGRDRGGRRAARARAAPDRGVLPVGLDRVRRLRGGGRARASRSRATCRSPATTTTRSRAWSRRRSRASTGGCPTSRRPRRRCSPRRWPAGRAGARARVRVAPALVERGSTARSGGRAGVGGAGVSVGLGDRVAPVLVFRPRTRRAGDRAALAFAYGGH